MMDSIINFPFYGEPIINGFIAGIPFTIVMVVVAKVVLDFCDWFRYRR